MGDLIRWFNEIPLAGLMLVVMIGFSIGRLSWRGLSLGPAGGTLLVALLLGRGGLSFEAFYGSTDPTFTLGAFGFALFIYSVGFEAGPRFFSSLFGGPGWRYVLVGAVVNIAALLLAVLFATVLALNDSLAAGLLSGALTSAPTYAAAAEICGNTTALAVSFALTYPIGLAGVVLMVQFLPRVMGQDLAKESDDEEEAAPLRPALKGQELTRAFEVNNEKVIGPTLRELDLTNRTGCYITRLHRSEDVRDVDAGTVLEPGDHLLVRGRFQELQSFQVLVGPEVYDDELRRKTGGVRKIRVQSAEVVGRPLVELELTKRYHSLIVEIDRGGVAIEPGADVTLQRGDVVTVQGSRQNLRALVERLGRYERSHDETDVAVYAGGILLGLLLGQIAIPAGGARLTLGYAGGLLVAGVLLGRFRSTGLIHANVPRAARQLVRDLGILLFVAETGVKAGESSFGVMEGHLVQTLLAAGGVTVLSVVIALFFAKWFLKMRAVDAWGSVGGGMTSSAALVAVKRAADSNKPALSYAASYAVASVLATIAGQVVVLLTR